MAIEDILPRHQTLENAQRAFADQIRKSEDERVMEIMSFTISMEELPKRRCPQEWGEVEVRFWDTWETYHRKAPKTPATFPIPLGEPPEPPDPSKQSTFHSDRVAILIDGIDRTGEIFDTSLIPRKQKAEFVDGIYRWLVAAEAEVGGSVVYTEAEGTIRFRRTSASAE